VGGSVATRTSSGPEKRRGPRCWAEAAWRVMCSTGLSGRGLAQGIHLGGRDRDFSVPFDPASTGYLLSSAAFSCLW